MKKMNNYLIANQLLKIAKSILSYKDVDQIHDMGGKVQRKDDVRPDRDDLRKHRQDPRKLPKEQRNDFDEVNNDKDLKIN